MSTPNPFAIDDEHRALVNTFVSLKAREDGVVEQTEMFELVLDYWLLLSDKTALQAEVEAIELDQLEAAVVNSRDVVTQQETEIADRKGGTVPPRTTAAPALAAVATPDVDGFTPAAPAEMSVPQLQAAAAAAGLEVRAPSAIRNDDD